jgi:hypothetical protein
MLQQGIHCVITDIIVSLCKNISSERKRTWPDGVGPICDWEEWVEKGRPNPTGTISSSLLPEYNPIAILRVLNDFFQSTAMQDRLKMSITSQRARNTPVQLLLFEERESPLIDLRTRTSMELFNGYWIGIEGGLRHSQRGESSNGPAISYVNYWDGSEWAHSSLDYISNYYKAWGCENDFVHPGNITIGFYTQGHSSIRHQQDPHNMLMYSDIDFWNDNNPYFWDRDETIRGFTKNEKKKIVGKFLRQLCEKYIVDEPGISPFNRATWYEVSEFIKFYYDSWQAIDHPVGDEEGWVAEGISPTPLSCYRYNSNMYNIPGVWSMDEGGKWSDNFERIMKLGSNHIDDWYNSIWKKKYSIYCQRVFEEDGIEIYRTIEDIESDAESESEEVPEQTQEIVNETPKEKVRNLMELIFENKTDMKEGVFLKLCNELKQIHDVL